MRTNFALLTHHNYNLSDLENMIPWERDAYLSLVVQWVQEENERRQQKRG